MFLYLASQRIEEARPLVRRELLPSSQGFARGFCRCIHVGGTSLRDFRENRARRRVGGLKVLAVRRSMPRAVDEMPEAPIVAIQPDQRLLGILRRGAVFH